MCFRSCTIPPKMKDRRLHNLCSPLYSLPFTLEEKSDRFVCLLKAEQTKRSKPWVQSKWVVSRLFFALSAARVARQPLARLPRRGESRPRWLALSPEARQDQVSLAVRPSQPWDSTAVAVADRRNRALGVAPQVVAFLDRTAWGCSSPEDWPPSQAGWCGCRSPDRSIRASHANNTSSSTKDTSNTRPDKAPSNSSASSADGPSRDRYSHRRTAPLYFWRR